MKTKIKIVEVSIIDICLTALCAAVVLMIVFHKSPHPSCEDYGLKTSHVHFEEKAKILKVECKQ